MNPTPLGLWATASSPGFKEFKNTFWLSPNSSLSLSLFLFRVLGLPVFPVEFRGAAAAFSPADLGLTACETEIRAQKASESSRLCSTSQFSQFSINISMYLHVFTLSEDSFYFQKTFPKEVAPPSGSRRLWLPCPLIRPSSEHKMSFSVLARETAWETHQL